MTASPTPLAELTEALERLARGADLPPSELPVLSDLDREQVKALEAAWPRIPDDSRVRLMTEAVRLADERVDVEFSRFAAVAARDPLAEVRGAAVEATREIGGEVALEYLREFAEEAPEGWAGLVGEAIEAASAVRRDRDLDAFDELGEFRS